MFHPIALELMAAERSEELLRLAQRHHVHRGARTSVRQRAAALFVRLGMLLDHAAAERAATHAHPAL